MPGSSTFSSANEGRDEFERLVGSAKHPLRVDMRHNNADSDVLDGMLDTIDIIPNFQITDGSNKGNMSRGVGTPTRATHQFEEDGGDNANGGKYGYVTSWSPQGLATQVRLGSRPMSAGSPGGRATGGSNRPPPRPMSAGTAGGRPMGGMGVAIGARAQHARGSDADSEDDDRGVGGGRSDDDDDDDGNRARGGKVNSSKDRSENGHGLISIIENKRDRDAPPGARFGTGGVGSMLDEQIRQMQESADAGGGGAASRRGAAAAASSSRNNIKGGGSFFGDDDAAPIKKESVKQRILRETKGIYNNKLSIPGDDEGDKHQHAQSSKRHHVVGGVAALAAGVHAGPAIRRRPASAGPGGAREGRLASITNTAAASTAGKARGGGGDGAKKSHSAQILMSGLQKLNPAILF